MSANTNDVQNKTYTYLNDGTPQNAANNVDSTFGQIYEYDFAGRLKTNQFGTGSSSPTPYHKQTISYDAFNNITGRSTWDKDENERSYTAAFTNNIKTSGGYGSGGYDLRDNEGNVVYNSAGTLDTRIWKFDGSGRMHDWVETADYGWNVRWDQGEALTFDGDGRVVKNVERRRVYASPPSGWYEEAEYSIYSSVTGQVINELTNTGAHKKTNVFKGDTLVAEYTSGFGVVFKTTDPVAETTMQSDLSGAVPAYDFGRIEKAAMGQVIPTQEPEVTDPPHNYAKGGSVNPEMGCSSPIYYHYGRKNQHRVPVPCDPKSEGILRLHVGLAENIPMTIDTNDGPKVVDPRFHRFVGFRVTNPNVLGRDIKTEATNAYNKFKEANKDCAKLAKKLGLDKEIAGADFLFPDSTELNSTLGELGFTAEEVGNVSDLLSSAEGDDRNFALTNYRTNIVYVFGRAFIENAFLPNKDKDTLFLGSTIFHESFHLKFNGDHRRIAAKLGLEYDKTSADPDTAASQAVDAFIDGGCVKKTKEKSEKKK